MGFALIKDRDYNESEGAIFKDGGSGPNEANNGAYIYRGASGHKSTFGQIRASIKFA